MRISSLNTKTNGNVIGCYCSDHLEQFKIKIYVISSNNGLLIRTEVQALDIRIYCFFVEVMKTKQLFVVIATPVFI